LRDDYEVSVRQLDHLVQLLRDDPAMFGARLTGAGFGGASVALCRPGEARAAGERVLRKYNEGRRVGAILVPA
jgi:galactokinase